MRFARLAICFFVFGISSMATCQSASWAEISRESASEQLKYYEGSVAFFVDKVKLTNPFLAERMRNYFLSTSTQGAQPDQYVRYNGILHRINEPADKLYPDSIVEHMASDHFGRIYGRAMAATHARPPVTQTLASDSATLARAGVKDDTGTPIAFLGTDVETISIPKKMLIYEQCSEGVLANLRKYHPEMVSDFYEFLYVKTSDEYEGDPEGYFIYQGVIDRNIKPRTDSKVNPQTVTAYQVLVSISKGHIEDLKKPKARVK